MSLPLARELAARSAGFTLQRGDRALIAAARTAIIDTLGVTLLGAVEPCTRIARAALVHSGGGPSELAGSSARASVVDAALVNGVACHANDFDDFTQDFGGHPSAPIVPGLLALAQSEGLGGFAFMQAYIAGVELETRIAHGVHFEHYEKGWHPTSTLGVFGAAAAAARLLELDPRATTHAIAIAASLSSGVKANFGTMSKPLQVGQCARNGVQAALLARAGFDANPAVLEHPQGFLEVYNGAGRYRVERMLEPWFDPPLVLSPGIGLKQFACCGSTHPSIYMALQLRERGVSASQVRRLQVLTHSRRLPHTDNPHPDGALAAKFSIQYCVARALLSGAPRLADFEHDAVNDPQVRALMARISAAPHPDMPADSHQNFGAELVAELADGRLERAFTAHMPGRDAQHPMSEKELYGKFEDCARRVLATPVLASLWSRLLRFEDLPGLDHLIAAQGTDDASAAVA